VQRDSELSEIMMRRFILRRVALVADGVSDMVLLGSRHSAATLGSRNSDPQRTAFTYRTSRPIRRADTARPLPHRRQRGPVVLCAAGTCCATQPESLATVLGLSADSILSRARLVIVGAGPSGLAARCMPAPKAWTTLVLETTHPVAGGHQLAHRELPRLPTGISGQALAGRALSQAEKFGTEVAIGRTAVRIDCDDRPYKVFLSDGEVVRSARS